jgi:hypothetical protein
MIENIPVYGDSDSTFRVGVAKVVDEDLLEEGKVIIEIPLSQIAGMNVDIKNMGQISGFYVSYTYRQFPIPSVLNFVKIEDIENHLIDERVREEQRRFQINKYVYRDTRLVMSKSFGTQGYVVNEDDEWVWVDFGVGANPMRLPKEDIIEREVPPNPLFKNTPLHYGVKKEDK